ncbi:MAG: hypothetical protein PHY43_00575 [Verrucomicrobiales bacterium]|nr:hypothetical protein [Verrucomicrobiales bacterium]
MRVITLNDDEALINYAQPIVAELRANMVRVDADFSATPFKAKIANAGVASSLWLERSAHSADTTRCWPPAVAWLRRGSVGGRDMEAGGERASAPRRPARREAEAGGHRGYSGRD